MKGMETMHEWVTVKKKQMNLWILIGSGAAIVPMFLLAKTVVQKYLLARIVDDLSLGGRIGYFCLCAVLYLANMWLVEIFFSGLSKWLLDRESYVVLRKSSTENPAAVHFYEEYQRKMRRIALLNQALMNVLMVGLLMFYLLKGGSAGQFSLLIWLVCFLAILNPVDRKKRKAEMEKRMRILYHDCDPVLSFDVYELFLQEPMARQEKNMHLLQQALSCYYLCDYPEMRRKLDGMQKILMQNILAVRIELKGMAAIDENRPDLFQQYSEELAELEGKLRMTEATRKVFLNVRKDWQGRIDLASPDPSRAEAYVNEELAKGKHPVEWMDSTFQMAWIQLCRGEKEQARANLQLVAERAGTMAIKKKAEEMLKTI